MDEWLRDAFAAGDGVAATTIASRGVLALLLGFAVAGLYRVVTPRRENVDALPLATTLVLLATLIALMTLAIGNSVARAFGVVGALSIVRFRTVVEDTRDTAFVILAVVVGMASGAGYWLLALAALPLAAAGALAMRAWSTPVSGGCPATLTVRLGLGLDPATCVEPTLREHASGARLTSVASARQGAAFDFVYAFDVPAPDSLRSLAERLNRIEGVQSVELRSIGDPRS